MAQRAPIGLRAACRAAWHVHTFGLHGDHLVVNVGARAHDMQCRRQAGTTSARQRERQGRARVPAQPEMQSYFHGSQHEDLDGLTTQSTMDCADGLCADVSFERNTRACLIAACCLFEHDAITFPLRSFSDG